MRITAVESRVYRYPLDPPFRAAWDPVPRTEQEATVVLVRTDENITGVASGGDGLPDRAQLERLLVGVDPLRTETVREICETVDFHGGRPWAVEVACWDALGKLLGEPVWRLLGGRQERLLAYASTGELATPSERAERAVGLRDAGLRALKIRFHHDDWRDDVEVILRSTGTTAVFVTHDQDEAFTLADRVGVLHQGRIEQIATPEEIYHRPATQFVAEFVGAADFLPGRVSRESYEISANAWA